MLKAEVGVFDVRESARLEGAIADGVGVNADVARALVVAVELKGVSVEGCFKADVLG